MSIRRPALLTAVAGLFSVGLVLAVPNRAGAETNDLQVCATQYQAAKADNKLNGQPWQDFFVDCKAHLPKAAEDPGAKAPAEPAAPIKSTTAKPDGSPEPAPTTAAPATADEHGKPMKDEKAGAESHEKKCHALWKAEAAELKKKDPKLTWSKYWKKCNEKLSGAKE